jgi:hypothetical protein
MFEDGEQLIAPITAGVALLLALLLFVAGARLLIRPFRWAAQRIRAATGLGASALGLALLIALYFEPGPFVLAVTLFIFVVRFVIYSLPTAFMVLAQQLPQVCVAGHPGNACAERILAVAMQLWWGPPGPHTIATADHSSQTFASQKVAPIQSASPIQHLDSVSDAVQFITSPPPALGLPGSLISVLLIAAAVMAVLSLAPRAIQQARQVDWRGRPVLLFYKGSALAVSLVFALYLSLTAIVAIPVFSDRTDRLRDGEQILNEQLPKLQELYVQGLPNKSSALDNLPDPKVLAEPMSQISKTGSSEQLAAATGQSAKEAAGPTSPQTNLATPDYEQDLSQTLKLQFLNILNTQINDLKDSNKILDERTNDFKQNAELFRARLTEHFHQQNTGHIGGYLTVQHATLLVGRYGDWLAEYTSNLSRCGTNILRAKSDVRTGFDAISGVLTVSKLASTLVSQLPNWFTERAAGSLAAELACKEIVPAYDPFLLSRQSPADSLALFGRATRWLLLTESRDLALIVGLLGFGFFGALATSFIRQTRSSASFADTALIVPALVRGVAAAILIFLAVVGGLAVFTRSDPEPNAYAVFLACFIAAVFSEDVWEWAQRRQRQQLRSGGQSQQTNPEKPVATPPEAGSEDKVNEPDQANAKR